MKVSGLQALSCSDQDALLSFWYLVSCCPSLYWLPSYGQQITDIRTDGHARDMDRLCRRLGALPENSRHRKQAQPLAQRIDVSDRPYVSHTVPSGGNEKAQRLWAKELHMLDVDDGGAATQSPIDERGIIVGDQGHHPPRLQHLECRRAAAAARASQRDATLLTTTNTKATIQPRTVVSQARSTRTDAPKILYSAAST